MSIKIVPQEQLEEQNEKAHIINKTPTLFYPLPKKLYVNRYNRMLFLAKNSPFADYLSFCAQIVVTQAKLIEKSPITQDLTLQVQKADEKGLAPLSLENYDLDQEWINYLTPIIESVENVNEVIAKTAENLKKNTKDELRAKAINLLNGKFNLVQNNESLFIWSALSLYYTQLASQLPGKAIAGVGEKRWQCPVCQSAPIASIIHTGNNVGSRYLHCSLCETQWHVPRAKCTNCDNLENITYFSLDNEHSAIKTECCEHCHSYLKIFNQDNDPHLDIIADDIHSLILDAETEKEKEEFAKSGVNPLLF